jgi:MATE family multidrug resistance protein
MGWFFGMQNAIYPLILTILINIINIICNVYFVNYLGMDADGVALGTVIAQYTGFITAIGLFLYKYRYLLSYFQQKAMLELAAFKAFMTLNADIFLRTFCLVFVFAYFDNQSAMMGDMTLAVNGVLLQFTFWVSYGVDGFGFAAESLVGKYFGAKNQSKFQKAITYSFYWGMGLAAIYSLFFAFFGESLLYVFTNQEAIIQAAIPFLIWLIVFPLAGTPAYIWDGIYIGMTDSKAMRNTMFLALLVFLLVLHLQLWFTDWGNHGLWAALTIFMAGRGVVQWWWYRAFMQKSF